MITFKSPNCCLVLNSLKAGAHLKVLSINEATYWVKAIILEEKNLFAGISFFTQGTAIIKDFSARKRGVYT